ncbi:hypothetical protein EYF80_008993 [Liparis tanakae]|uniref:Uncharacterized protein n=1 Tax=Liparis tanakae TaxID=230148 RepID=A0A4Z2IRW5_9TELE|nr:hypothetical protein EYF80_008993 [Liparis tanakae]
MKTDRARPRHREMIQGPGKPPGEECERGMGVNNKAVGAGRGVGHQKEESADVADPSLAFDLDTKGRLAANALRREGPVSRCGKSLAAAQVSEVRPVRLGCCPGPTSLLPAF